MGKGPIGERTSGIKQLTCSGPPVDRFVDHGGKCEAVAMRAGSIACPEAIMLLRELTLP